MMNKILTINKKTDTYWFQERSEEGEVLCSTGIISIVGYRKLIKEAKGREVPIFNISNIKSAVMARLYKKFFNGRGYTDDVEMFAEALRMNKAVEIK